MEYKYEHIAVDDPNDEWVDELARMFAEIIYKEMADEKISSVVQQ